MTDFTIGPIDFRPSRLHGLPADGGKQVATDKEVAVKLRGIEP